MSFEKKYILLFQNCLSVKGYRRSAIYDLYKNDYYLIPNALHFMLLESKTLSIDEIKSKYGSEKVTYIDEYIQFILENNLGHLVNKEELHMFPSLNLEWDYPSVITNAIIDIGSWCNDFLDKTLVELQQLLCSNLQIRCYNEQTTAFWETLLNKGALKEFKCIEIIMKFHSSLLSEEFWRNHFHSNPAIHNIQVHSTPSQYIPNTLPLFGKVYFYEQAVNDESDCGCINAKYFHVSMELFTESINYNSCLNRKISIDKLGEIKNCPSIKSSFGHVSKISLADALLQPNFKDKWLINKDQIRVCSDCEFRYMCTDCRVYITDNEDSFSKPAKCGYDPYTAQWHNQPIDFTFKRREEL